MNSKETRRDLDNEINFVINEIKNLIDSNEKAGVPMQIKDQADLNRYSETLLLLCQSRNIL